MTETLRRPLKNDVDARVARFLAAEEEKRKAEKKEAIRALAEPAGVIVIGGIIASVFGLVYGPALKDSLDASPAKDVASVIEEWSISHPTKQLPMTDEYVSYPSYLQGLGKSGDENSPKNPEELMVKVVNSDGVGTEVGFTVCAYSENDGEALYSFNSVTGERVENKVKTCS